MNGPTRAAMNQAGFSPFSQNFPPPSLRPPYLPPPNNTTLPKPPIFDVDGEVWFEACSAEGKVYYFNAKTRETSWTRPNTGEVKSNNGEENEETKDEANILTDEATPITSKAEEKPKDAASSAPFLPPMVPGMPPPFGLPPMGVMPPPFSGFPPHIPHNPRFPPPGYRLPSEFVPMTKGDWTEHRLPDGRLYYFNNNSKESKWDKPAEFNENVALDESSTKESDISNTSEERKVEETEDMKRKKPIASRPVLGSVWHLVWTGDGKVFFFNPTSRMSIWERPKELEGNLKIDEMLLEGPLPEKKIEVSKETPGKEISSLSNKDFEDESDDQPVKKKKKKIEEEEVLLNDNIRALPIMKDAAKLPPGMVRHEIVEDDKSTLPLEDRMDMFTDLLREKEISAFSTWEKELHKILYDSRYMLLNARERKLCYDNYVKVRAVEERKERVQKLKEKKEAFKMLLDDVISGARITFSEFASKHSKDVRFKGIEKMRERELLFNEFMSEFRKHEKERMRLREQKLRKHFFELLDELNNLDDSTQWKKVKSSVETDKRYQLVGSSSKREKWFYDYIKEKIKREGAPQLSPPQPSPPPPDAAPLPAKDKPDAKPPVPMEAEMERNIRVEASIRKRQEEVRATKEMIDKDNEKERGYHQHEKATQHFKALLADMVKDTHYSWKETRRSLRKDPRWSALEVLAKDEKEELFNEHVFAIKGKRKKAFRRLLDETEIALDANWREVRRKVKDDPRYSKYGTSDTREEEFEFYLRERVTEARSDFRELLRETKLITYKSKKLCQESNHFKDIIEILKKDKRYHLMDTLSNEREQLITSYMDDLHRRGPPPPPTATNPSARYKKD